MPCLQIICLVAKKTFPTAACGNVWLPTLSFLLTTHKIEANFVHPLMRRIDPNASFVFVDEVERESFSTNVSGHADGERRAGLDRSRSS